ncbi:MAG: hypothetical protein ACM31C_00855 [Acidobacteriota bacterium]
MAYDEFDDPEANVPAYIRATFSEEDIKVLTKIEKEMAACSKRALGSGSP